MFGFRGDGFDLQVIYVMIMADLSLAHRFNILMEQPDFQMQQITADLGEFCFRYKYNKITVSINARYSKPEHTFQNGNTMHLLWSLI